MQAQVQVQMAAYAETEGSQEQLAGCEMESDSFVLYMKNLKEVKMMAGGLKSPRKLEKPKKVPCGTFLVPLFLQAEHQIQSE